MIALGIPRVTKTMMVERQLGTSPLVMIQKVDAPQARLASMYSFSFNCITEPRIMRAVRTQVKSPRAINRFKTPFPRKVMIAMAKIRSGNAWKIHNTGDHTVDTAAVVACNSAQGNAYKRSNHLSYDTDT